MGIIVKYLGKFGKRAEIPAIPLCQPAGLLAMITR
jgi:hypothetical protein